ncbi:MAG: hypothetical protein IPP69_04570 [Flavobacteriales bacterium]|nr:hypothetical protein [Flavobacteriales bacterium]
MNTNILFDNVLDLTRSITNNIDGVIADINKLRASVFAHKFVMFIVFPITHDNPHWTFHLNRITVDLSNYVYREFTFSNNIPSVIYCDEVV